jgi:hypothetical protein
VKEGFGAFTHALAQDLDIRLNTVVNKISYSDTGN